MTTLATRLKTARKNKRLTQAQVADKTDMSQPNYAKLESGKSLETGKLYELSNVLGVSYAWLKDGEGDISDTNTTKPYAENVVVGEVETDIQIPIYESYFCCGDGNDTDFEEIKGYRGFSPEFFAKRNLKPENFKLVCASNDSMSPHIEHGDEVGIDIADKEIKDGEVYAILLDGAKMFKQVFVMGGGVIKLHCFNDKYEDKILTPETLSSLVIVGRKVYRAG